jgi:anti-sigma regulatory factor (Ser/Thr protein kinase)
VTGEKLEKRYNIKEANNKTKELTVFQDNNTLKTIIWNNGFKFKATRESGTFFDKDGIESS